MAKTIENCELEVDNPCINPLDQIKKLRGKTVMLKPYEFSSLIKHPLICHITGMVIAAQIVNGTTTWTEELWMLEEGVKDSFDFTFFGVDFEVVV